MPSVRSLVQTGYYLSALAFVGLVAAVPFHWVSGQLNGFTLGILAPGILGSAAMWLAARFCIRHIFR